MNMSVPEKIKLALHASALAVHHPHEAVIAYPLVCAKMQSSRNKYVGG